MWCVACRLSVVAVSEWYEAAECVDSPAEKVARLEALLTSDGLQHVPYSTYPTAEHNKSSQPRLLQASSHRRVRLECVTSSKRLSWVTIPTAPTVGQGGGLAGAEESIVTRTACIRAHALGSTKVRSANSGVRALYQTTPLLTASVLA